MTTPDHRAARAPAGAESAAGSDEAAEAVEEGGAEVAPGEAGDPREAGEPGDAGEESDPGDAERAVIADVADRARVRRAPRYGSFAFAGIVLGGLIALGLVQFRAMRVEIPPPGPSLDAGGLFLLLWVVLGTFGAFGGVSLALWLDRRSMRRR